MSIRKFLSTLAICLASVNSLIASDIGVDIPAASYSSESHGEDRNIIRRMANKVGYLKPDIESAVYWGYDDFDFGSGATHLTVRVASGGKGGTLYVRLATFYYGAFPDLAVVDIPATGGWNSFQDITVEINQETLANLKGLPLYFAVEPDGENDDAYLFDIQSFRFDNLNVNGQVGVDIAGASYDFESSPEDPNMIRPMGDTVGFVKATEGYAYWGYENFDFGIGAKTMTVTASSGSAGGKLYVQLMNHYNLELTVAVVDIPNTGGWTSFKDFTVPVNPDVIANFNGTSLFFVVSDNQTSGYQFDVKSFRFDN